MPTPEPRTSLNATLRRLFTRLWKRGWRVRAIARVMVYCAVVFGIVGLVALRSAYGDMKESALIIGRQLAQFKDLLGDSHRLLLNGQPIYIASAMTDQPVKQVLDRFDTACRKEGDGLKQEFENLPAALQEKMHQQFGNQDTAGLGIVRKENDHEGLVACLAQAPSQAAVPVTKRLAEFVKTGDIAKVGLLRYVYAVRTPAGTHVITAWTDGSFHLFSLAPLDGSEPPGSDPANAMRPPDSVRVLTAQITGVPHSVRIYDSKAKPAKVLSSYDDQMPKLGWRPIRFVAKEAASTRAYTRQGVDMLVFAYPHDGHSYVSMVEMRSE
jgi:hypothetical protein